MPQVLKNPHLNSGAELNPIEHDQLRWKKLRSYYFEELKRYLRFLILPGSSVMELGCRTGDVLASLGPSRGLGIDSNSEAIRLAKSKYSNLEFRTQEYGSFSLEEKFDYVVLSDAIGYVQDIQSVFTQLQTVCRSDTRVVIIYFNYFWAPLLKFAEFLRLRQKRPVQHWLPLDAIENLLHLSDFEVVRRNYRILCPFKIPVISSFLNRVVANLPFFWKLCVNEVIVARLLTKRKAVSDVSCSIVIPCRNEKGNIENAIKRTPRFSKQVEFVFIEGHSRDGTYEECVRMQAVFPELSIRVFRQEGAGKADAIRKGFAEAKNDILMILDADLTTPPEDLPKFYDAITSGKGEFVNGSRFVYQMEKQAMRVLNLMANKFFSRAFSYLLEQPLRDTLCGTKVLWRDDYEKIKRGRSYFGEFDPFGDFDLLFGAARLNLKIVEIPVHYKERTYGTTQIHRFRHGWLLFKMTIFALRKLKFV